MSSATDPVVPSELPFTADVVRGVQAVPPMWGTVVTLGTFDGVHLGHRSLLDRAVDAARNLEVRSVAYTFDPHPAKILAPDMAPRTLMSLRDRTRLIKEQGIDLIVVEPFTSEFAQISADEWLENYLVARLRPRHVIVGFNFTYGRDKAGCAEHLTAAGERYGFTVETVKPVRVKGVVASSTRVRAFLLEGNPAGARMVLGRDFTATGRVVRGDERGRTLGFPTANLDPEHDIVPARGVYATRVEIVTGPHAGEVFDAVTNIGNRPTFKGGTVTIESFLLSFSGDLYGARLRVALVSRMRDEQRFESVEALTKQLEHDVEEAREVLSR